MNNEKILGEIIEDLIKIVLTDTYNDEEIVSKKLKKALKYAKKLNRLEAEIYIKVAAFLQALGMQK